MNAAGARRWLNLQPYSVWEELALPSSTSAIGFVVLQLLAHAQSPQRFLCPSDVGKVLIAISFDCGPRCEFLPDSDVDHSLIACLQVVSPGHVISPIEPKYALFLADFPVMGFRDEAP